MYSRSLFLAAHSVHRCAKFEALYHIFEAIVRTHLVSQFRSRGGSPTGGSDGYQQNSRFRVK